MYPLPNSHGEFPTEFKTVRTCIRRENQMSAFCAFRPSTHFLLPGSIPAVVPVPSPLTQPACVRENPPRAQPAQLKGMSSPLALIGLGTQSVNTQHFPGQGDGFTKELVTSWSRKDVKRSLLEASEKVSSFCQKRPSVFLGMLSGED